MGGRHLPSDKAPCSASSAHLFGGDPLSRLPTPAPEAALQDGDLWTEIANLLANWAVLRAVARSPTALFPGPTLLGAEQRSVQPTPFLSAAMTVPAVADASAQSAVAAMKAATANGASSVPLAAAAAAGGPCAPRPEEPALEPSSDEYRLHLPVTDIHPHDAGTKDDWVPRCVPPGAGGAGLGRGGAHPERRLAEPCTACGRSHACSAASTGC